MASGSESNRCSICEKSEGKYNCGGCKHYFCIKHLIEHHQQLSTKFDADILSFHDKLLEQMNEANKSDASRSELFDEIHRWECATTEKVRNAAECARQQLTQMLNQKKDMVTKDFEIIKKEILDRRENEDFDENDIERLRQKLSQIQISLKQLIQPTKKKVIVTNDGIDWNSFIYVENEQNRITPSLRASSIDIPPNAQWQQNGTTVAGGNGLGSGINQLNNPLGLCVDEEKNIYIADLSNDRIMEWKLNATNGKVFAGGNGPGKGAHQLHRPINVIVDKESDSLIISDSGNRRIVRWPRRNGNSRETIISNINCLGIAMDENGSVYVVDGKNHEVRRYRTGESKGTVVAGGNGKGDRLDQFSSPQCVFVDRNHSVYVSDLDNHRVMKWEEGAKQGIVVAGGQGRGNSLTQLYVPLGVFVDQLGTVYVADQGNHRIMCWPKGAVHASIIVGGNGRGQQSNQFENPISLSFDRHGNLYVTDQNNNRVQRFSIQ